MEFDLDKFMDDLNKDGQKTGRSAEDRLNKVLMNTRDNQGTVMFIPFVSKTVGNIYVKLQGVKEFKTYTTIIDREDPIWYKVLPKEFYGTLTPQQEELYDQVCGMWEDLADSDDMDYTEIRNRNYSLFFGVATEAKSIDDDEIKGFPLNVPALFIYPSTNVIEKLNEAIASKKSTLKNNVGKFLSKIITPAHKNRQGVLQVTYKKADIGYDASVNLEVNTEYAQVTDPSKEYDDQFCSHFDDPISAFIGFMYDNENETRFNETAFRELAQAMELRLKELSSKDSDEVEVQNNNGGDPMLDQKPPVPGVDGHSASKRPF